jgi:hypothetical protein
MRCAYIHITVNDGQLTIQYTAGIRKEHHDQFISASIWKPPWSTNPLSTQSAKLKIMMSLAVGISCTDFEMSVPGSRQNRL